MVREPIPIAAVLGQPLAPTTPTIVIVLWAGSLIVVALVGGMLILWIRGRLVERRSEAAGAGTTLEQMRRLRDRGQLSQQEFDAARASLISRLSGQPAPAGQARAAERPSEPGAMLAKPGFDLTGAPLPRPPAGATNPQAPPGDMPR